MDRKAASSKSQKETKPSRTLSCCSLAKTRRDGSLSPLFLDSRLQHRPSLQKADDSLNISRSEITFIHPRIINPQSTKFFEKK